jgi:hypothetical protein
MGLTLSYSLLTSYRPALKDFRKAFCGKLRLPVHSADTLSDAAKDRLPQTKNGRTGVRPFALLGPVSAVAAATA